MGGHVGERGMGRGVAVARETRSAARTATAVGRREEGGPAPAAGSRGTHAPRGGEREMAEAAGQHGLLRARGHGERGAALRQWEWGAPARTLPRAARQPRAELNRFGRDVSRPWRWVARRGALRRGVVRLGERGVPPRPRWWALVTPLAAEKLGRHDRGVQPGRGRGKIGLRTEMDMIQ